MYGPQAHKRDKTQQHDRGHHTGNHLLDFPHRRTTNFIIVAAMRGPLTACLCEGWLSLRPAPPPKSPDHLSMTVLLALPLPLTAPSVPTAASKPLSAVRQVTKCIKCLHMTLERRHLSSDRTIPDFREKTLREKSKHFLSQDPFRDRDYVLSLFANGRKSVATSLLGYSVTCTEILPEPAAPAVLYPRFASSPEMRGR